MHIRRFYAPTNRESESGIVRYARCPGRVQAGTIWVNTYRAVSYMLPFGGYKRSGLGRESGQQAIHEYLQTKSVCLNFAEEAPNPFVIG